MLLRIKIESTSSLVQHRGIIELKGHSSCYLSSQIQTSNLFTSPRKKRDLPFGEFSLFGGNVVLLDQSLLFVEQFNILIDGGSLLINDNSNFNISNSKVNILSGDVQLNGSSSTVISFSQFLIK